LGDGELTGRDLGIGNPCAVALDHDSGEVVGPPLIEHLRFGQCARGNDPLDTPLHRTAAARLTHLLCQRDPVALLDQPGNIALDGVVRNARHRDPDVLGDRTRGKEDVQLPRGNLRVFIEGFVEVAEAEEQNRIRILRLQVQILLTQRRRVVRGHALNYTGEHSMEQGPPSDDGPCTSFCRRGWPPALSKVDAWGS